MKALTITLLLSLLSTQVMALPSRNPSPILGEAVDSTQLQMPTEQ
ncbi:hypothetical protein Pstr01_15940 [Pseudomonas straminea]|uniref:Uncharacterized protein n=1 Tax=Pseudomonas straminea TaxID=47882 RepID=A0A1I1VLD6_PSEOC|nr:MULTISPECIES: hypothetical protein [Pseudomonas]TWE10702.1 hypothetical protein FB481_101191 [Pseudomonas sp. AG1028]GLX13355.1 hypothetical protein Pstr01_15940 [Pseudomonas straminea]SFD83634.1 hypothetical protein SAMN05216372_104454 [Pseudomonas straminea]